MFYHDIIATIIVSRVNGQLCLRRQCFSADVEPIHDFNVLVRIPENVVAIGPVEDGVDRMGFFKFQNYYVSASQMDFEMFKLGFHKLIFYAYYFENQLRIIIMSTLVLDVEMRHSIAVVILMVWIIKVKIVIF